jgi:hypothetical protein
MPHIEDDTLDLVIASLAELRELLVEVQAANRESEQVLTELEADANLKRIRKIANRNGFTLRTRNSTSEGHCGVFEKLQVNSYIELRNPHTNERHCFRTLIEVGDYVPPLSYLEFKRGDE